MKRNIDYYMAQPYQMVVVKGEEGIYTVFFPDLPGCITTGATPEEAVMNAEDAKKCWFQACMKDHVSIPKPRELTYQ